MLFVCVTKVIRSTEEEEEKNHLVNFAVINADAEACVR